jgi:hypothetical protein
MSYHRVIAKVTRRITPVEQELFTHPEHLNSHPVLCAVRSVFSCLCSVL